MSQHSSACQTMVMTVQYLGPTEVAVFVERELGGKIAATTVRQYAAKGYMPEPDVRIGPNAGWSEDTIRTWWASRPGRGRWGARKHPAGE